MKSVRVGALVFRFGCHLMKSWGSVSFVFVKVYGNRLCYIIHKIHAKNTMKST